MGADPMVNASGRLRRPTMRDVAVRVGVSQTLVSLVFRNAPGASAETRERVMRAAAELGYRPDTAAQVLRRNRSRHIGLLFTLRQPFDIDLVEALYPAAERHGYRVVLGAIGAGRDDRRAVEELLSFRSEALILDGTSIQAAQLARVAGDLPIVDIGRRATSDTVDAVRVAAERGSQLAVDHLIGLGHRSIVHIDGGDQPAAAERRRGYQRAMRRHGLPREERILPGDYTGESGAAAARHLLREESLPTAIFAANDRCAHGALDVLSQAGLAVPADISVVGYDDSDIARLSFVNLTTVHQDAALMADQAVQAVIERLDYGRTEPRDIVLDPSLVIRATTGPPRPGAVGRRPAPGSSRSRSGSPA
jgi:DNA-binding LacI/PurR family transcriptional regulator